jgi:hypothetical protein
MAISTYSQLKEALTFWSGREGDTTILSGMERAISLVEARFNRILRVSDMEAQATGTTSSGIIDLPSDFLAVRRVEVSPYGTLTPAPPKLASDEYPSGAGTYPRFYTILGLSMQIVPDTTSTVTLDYYQKIPSLSDEAPTNWLLTDHPDLYLYATLGELAALGKNAPEAAAWMARGDAILNEIITLDRAKRYSDAIVGIKGPTP